MAEVGVTKQVLAYALKDLMTRQPLSKITVGDICQACGMNRKSFYYHFQDKYDLVAWIFRGELATEAEGVTTLMELMGALCRTMEKNVPFYRAALKDRGQNSLMEYIADELRPIVRRELAPRIKDVPHGEDIPEMYVDACCICLLRWVQSGCSVPSGEFNRLIRDAMRIACRME